MSRIPQGLPEYDWGTAPTDQLATRRQLRAARLRPGGHGPVAILRCRGCATHPQRTCTRPAYLNRRDLARTARPMAPTRSTTVSAIAPAAWMTWSRAV